MSNYKSSKLSNILLAVVLILVSILVIGAVLGIVKGKDTTPDTPIDNVQTNPLDEIKPVDKLTSDMWVTGWLIDPAKEPNMDKVNAFIDNNGITSEDEAIVMAPIDFDTLNYSDFIVGSMYDPSCASLFLVDGGFGFVPASDSAIVGLYGFKGSETHAIFGQYGWFKGVMYSVQPITEKCLIELPCAMKYDCTYYDIVKEFLTPVVDEKHECVKPVALDETRLVKGLRLKEVGYGFDISDSDLKCGDEFFKGTVAYNPLGGEMSSGGFRLVQEDNSIYLHGNFGGQRLVYRSVYYDSSNYGSLNGYLLKHIDFNSGSILFPNGVLYKFDNEEYMNKKLWRFFEPIYAEKVTDPAKQSVVGYNVDWSKVGYVNLDRTYSMNSFRVSSNSVSHNFTEISTQLTLKYIDISASTAISGGTNSFRYFENLEQVREVMTQLNYEGTLADFMQQNFNITYDDAQYGTLTYSVSNTTVSTMIDWLKANGFESAVTPIYSQYK